MKVALNDRWARVLEANRGFQSGLILFFSFFVFLISTIFINQLHIIYPMWFTFEPWIIIGLVFLNLMVAFLFGVIINMLVLRLRESRQATASMGLAPVGVFAAILGGACPGCLTGLLPLVLASFGTGFSLLSLPLNGAELLMLSGILMVWSVYLLANPSIACKVPSKKHYSGKRKQ